MEKRSYVLLDENGEPVSINEVPVYKPEDILLHLQTLKPILYGVVTISLATARTGINSEEFVIAGDFLEVQDISGTATAKIVFNEPTYPRISVTDHLAITTPFYRFFIINTAQAGETLTLIFGKESLFKLTGSALTKLDVALSTRASEIELAKKVNKAITPVIYNVTVTTADTEYSQVLPASTKRFRIVLADGAGFRLAFVTGKVATPTAPYWTQPANIPYTEEMVEPATLTLYFACGTGTKVAQIVAWS